MHYSTGKTNDAPNYDKMTARMRLLGAAGLLAALALAALPAAPASAADSLSVTTQVCVLDYGPSCDPTQPLPGTDWASSATVLTGNEVWWRVVVTNTGTDAVTSVTASTNLASTDCGGSSVTASLAAGASHSYVCQTNPAPAGTYKQTVSVSATAPSGTVRATSAAATATVPPSSHGYWLVGSDGGVFSFGNAQFYGSTGKLVLQRPVVGIVATKDRGGYWLDATDGGVFSFGDTQFFGSIPGLGLHPAGSGQANSLNAPMVGMVASHDQGGYFMVASDGGVFAFGDATFAGSCPGIGGCAGAAVAVMPDRSGHGYWLVTSTGNVYAFGDAPYLGAPGRGPVVSAVAAPDGGGYWILLNNGAVYAYGDAAYFGSLTGANNASAIFCTFGGGGYWIVSSFGAVYAFGDAPYLSGMAGTTLNGPIIAASGS